MDGASTFGLWLRARRKASDLTQEQLAERVGCAAETIRKIEADARRPSRAMADRLLHVLEVPAADRAALLRWARDTSAVSAERVRVEESSTDRANAAATPIVPVLSPQPKALVPLLKTKLYIPRSRSNLVSRGRLLARLDAGAAGRLTVVAAPPGFGKTTLLASWLASLAERQKAKDKRQNDDTGHLDLLPFTFSLLPSHVAWLSLDVGDNDPILFLRYLIAALQTIMPAAGMAALGLLEAGNVSHAAAALPILVDDLSQLPGRSVLILDDYHAIEALPVHEAVVFLLDHLPPQLQLVIASRADPPLPLARLRARGELTELRAADLRFTPAEAATFLQDVMRVRLSPDDVAALEARTEGWIAGLQLAALSLQARPPDQIAAFVAAFAGSHHFVVDYLADEVLARQPVHVHTFLLQTSVLDRLSGSLCDALLGVGSWEVGDREAPMHTNSQLPTPNSLGSYSQRILEELERANLFLVPLDDERRWYRYHQLFADVLRDRLLRGAAAAEIETLHRRASRWFEQRGLVAEAIRHAVAGQDWDGAARLVERASGAIVLGNMQQHQTLRTWVEALPEQVVRGRPKLCLLRARLAMLTDLAQVEHWVRLAEQALEQAGSTEDTHNTRGEIAALLAGLAASRGAALDAIEHAQRALADLDTTNAGVRGEVMEYLARAYLFQHDAGRAAEALAQMAALARAAGDHMATFIPEANLAYLQRLQGKHSVAIQTCRRALDWGSQHGADTAPDASWALAGLADLLRERNDLDAALAYASDAATRSKQLAIPNLMLLCSLVLARVHQARGEVDQARAIVATMRGSAEQFRIVPLQGLFRAFEAQLHLQQGGLAAAMELVGEQTPQPEMASYWISPILVVYSYEHLAIARAQVCLARGGATGSQHQLQEAYDLLSPQLEHAEREGLPWLRVKVLVLQALVDQALGKLPQALAVLRRALELAAPEGLMRVLLDEGAPMRLLIADCRLQVAREIGNQSIGHTGSLLVYIDKLLTAFPGNRAQVGNERSTDDESGIYNPQSAMVEPLTARELEVVRLLGSGLSNQAIALELVVAVGTVKRHIANILSKLQVDSRLAAVARARELGLL